jgi:hypothetical protein
MRQERIAEEARAEAESTYALGRPLLAASRPECHLCRLHFDLDAYVAIWGGMRRIRAALAGTIEEGMGLPQPATGYSGRGDSLPGYPAHPL